jgi:hypothetical protein
MPVKEGDLSLRMGAVKFLDRLPTGSGSVTVMTVTLAFKAFAKAIPRSTPFLATSDPSVLKRILAYIRGGSLARRTFSRKRDSYLYGAEVSATEQ